MSRVRQRKILDALIEQATSAFDRFGRAELAVELRAAHKALEFVTCPVTLMGPCDSGKSSLLNALLSSDVSPVDPACATALPVIVRGARSGTRAVVYVGDLDDLEAEELDLVEVRTLLTRRLEDPEPSGVHAVEIELDRSLLHAGLILVDVPSLRTHGRRQRRLVFDLLGISSLLVVLDASQEIDQPWIELLIAARDSGQPAVVAMTKVDLVPHWRRVVEATRSAITSAGLDVAVVPVSSRLRHQAISTADHALNARSGFPELSNVLLTTLVEPMRRRCQAELARQIELAVTEIRGSLALAASTADTNLGPSLAEQMEAFSIRASRLASAKADLPRLLKDRLDQLQFDFDAFVNRSLLDFADGVTGYIDTNDPTAAWPEITALVEEEQGVLVDRLFAFLDSEIGHISDDLADRVDKALGQLTIDIDRSAMKTAVERVRMERLRGSKRGVQDQVLETLRGTAGASAVGTLLATVGGGELPAMLIFLGVSAPLTALFGRKAWRASGENRLNAARTAAHKQFARYSSELRTEVGAASRRIAGVARQRVVELVNRQFEEVARALAADREILKAAAEAARTTPDPAVSNEQKLSDLIRIEKAAVRLRADLEIVRR